MCDYSLHDVKSRKAAKGDDLMLRKFGWHNVTGFGRPEDGAQCVTCVPHGATLLVTFSDGKAREAIFGHNDNGQWADGLIFANVPNFVYSLQDVALGAMAKVIMLPLDKSPAAQTNDADDEIVRLEDARQLESVHEY